MKKKSVIKTVIFGFFAFVFLYGGIHDEDISYRLFGLIVGALFAYFAIKPYLPQKQKAAEPDTVEMEIEAMEADPEKVDYPFTSIPPKDAIKVKDYIVFDTETTGFSPREDKVIELTALKIRNGEISRFSTLVNPERRIPQRTIKIHGITDRDVAGKPYFSQIVQDLDAFLDADLPIVGHNVTFDLRFLWWAFHDAGRELSPRYYIDTYKLSKKAIPGRSTYSLASLIHDYALIEGEQTHRTDDDVTATNSLFKLCSDKLHK